MTAAEYREGTAEFNSLLAAWRAGDEKARNRVVAIIHDEVSTIASIILKRNPGPRSIVTNDLVNEALLKLIQSEDIVLNDRAHLIALCARIMRFILIDSIRRRSAAKRKGDVITLNTSDGADAGPDANALALDAALRRLQAIDPSRARIVEMRYFGGMTLEEIGAATGASPATVKRSWQVTRAWLRGVIENDIA